MKKIILVWTILGFLVLTVRPVFAAWFEKVKAPQQKEKVVTVVTQSPVKEIIAKKKAELNGTAWTIEMRPMSSKGRTEKDVISFSQDKVMSNNLATLGYMATNFTVRLEDDGTVVWETMQTSEKDGQAFWRGDIKDGVMRGVLSKRDKKNRAYDFNFVSVTK